MTDYLLEATNCKNVLYIQFLQTPLDHEDYKERKKELKLCQKQLRRDRERGKRKYYFNLFNKYKADMKSTWREINQVLYTQSDELNITLEIDNALISDTQVIADKFNEFFSSIGKSAADKSNQSSSQNIAYQSFLTNPTDQRFQFDGVNEGLIVHLIHGLKSTNTMGHDLLSNKLLKSIKNEISKPLTFIINQSLHTGIFPDKLKLARVRPLFKKR